MRPAINIARSRISTLLPKQTTLSFTPPRPFQPLLPFSTHRPLLLPSIFLRHHMSEPEAKRVKMSASPVIGTHNGHFHADEALAVYLLRLLPQYTNSSLIRTRDAEVLKTCDIVCDVGGVHDHDAKRYDHHQREFNAVFPGSATKLSSAGLVWMHYGKQIIEAVTGLSASDANNDLLYNKLYADFIEAFDANDNGIPVYDPAALRSAGIEKRFSEKGFSMAGVVNRFNYATTAPRDAAKASVSADAAAEPKQKSQDEEDTRFLKASHFVGEQFVSELLDKHNSWLPAREVVKQAFADRTQYDAQGRIIVIPHRPEGVPWMEHLYNLEEENNAKGAVLYALFAESGEADSKWRIRAVSLEPGSFENRKGLPEAWRGVRDEDLSKVSGIPGSIFVHASGFIGGNATFEGALKMAQQGADL